MNGNDLYAVPHACKNKNKSKDKSENRKSCKDDNNVGQGHKR